MPPPPGKGKNASKVPQTDASAVTDGVKDLDISKDAQEVS